MYKRTPARYWRIKYTTAAKTATRPLARGRPLVRSGFTSDRGLDIVFTLNVPTPASKSRSKMSLMVQAEPRTMSAAIKNLNISVQNVVKSKLVLYAAIVKPHADFIGKSDASKIDKHGLTKRPEHEDGTSRLYYV